MPASEIVVTIGPITFNSSFTPGATMYLLRNTENILGALGTRRSDTPNQGAHGVQDSQSQYEGRLLRFQGFIHATSQAQRVAMQQDLDEALSLPRSQSFDGDDGYKLVQITDEDGIDKQVYAKVTQMPDYDLVDTGMPESRAFQFEMFAPGPEVYAQDLTSGAGPESFDTTTFTFKDGDLPTFKDGDLPTFQDLTGSVLEVENAGNYGTPPLITITGPAENPTVTNVTAGKALAFTRNGGLTLADGETLTINVAEYTAVVTPGGTNVRSKISLDSSWFDILPGTNELTLTDETVGDLTGQIEVEFRSAWV